MCRVRPWVRGGTNAPAHPGSPIGTGEASCARWKPGRQAGGASSKARPVWVDNRPAAPTKRGYSWPEVEVGFSTPVMRAELTKAERVTLEIGFVITFATLTAGLDLGRWPLWSAPVALGGYFAWTVLYSEATIQAARWQLSAGAPKQSRLSLPAKPVSPPG